jgi:hypothetical protein
LHWLAYQHHHYGYETHWGYTVAGPADHLAKIVIYEAIVLLSPWPALAGVLFAAALAGAVYLAARAPKAATIVLVFPIVYVVYFSVQRVMIVRNLMVVSPFVAVACAAGLAAMVKSIRRRPVRLFAAAAVTAAVAFDLGFTVYAAWTIREAGQTIDYDIIGLRDYMSGHAQTQFDLSRMTRGFLAQLDAGAAGGSAPAHPDREVVVTCSEEDDELMKWPANIWNLTLATFGPLDVNFNYYPTWERNRIVVLDRDRARDLGIVLAR